VIFFSKDGLLTITGGKLTAFRNMAEDLLKEIAAKGVFPNIIRNKNFSKQPYKISLDKKDWIESLKNSKIQVDIDVSDHLYQQYGKGALNILEIIQEDKTLKEKIIEENNFIKAEIIYCLRNELTPHLIDIFCRRTEMSLWISHEKSLDAAEIIATIMASEYSWDTERKTDEINTYLKYIKKSVSFL
ncbi:unnamed protein product, partial [marine sediment metagenome]